MGKIELTGYPSIDKPWLKYYTEEAMNTPLPQQTIFESIFLNNKQYPSDIALLYFGKKISYKKLFAEIEKTAKAFVFAGVKAGENVVLCMPAVPETIYAILALNRLGANAVLLNPLFSETQLVDRIRETEATILLVINELYQVVVKVIPQTNIKTVVACPAVNSLGLVVKILKKVRRIKGTVDWNIFIKRGQSSILPNIPPHQAEYPAIMVYSSGTTGASKGIQLTNDSVNSTICEGVQIGFSWKRGDRWFSQVPIWFSTGICASTLVPLRYGISIILEPLYDFNIFYQHILKYKPNFMITACGLLDYLMMNCPKSNAYKEFKFLCVGGEYVTKGAETKYNQWLKNNGNEYGLYKGYGMCECGGTVTASSPKCNAIGSAGIPTPNVVVAAFDPLTNTELKYGQRGEIRVLTPCRMSGYYKQPEATAQFFHRDELGRVWACTGDMGHVAEDGNVYVDGRLSESYINKEGRTIYLFDIERAVLSVEGVRQCRAVASEIDGILTHVLHISLVKQAKEETVLREIISACQDALDADHMPVWFKLYSDALPVAPSGKLDISKMQNDISGLIKFDLV